MPVKPRGPRVTATRDPVLERLTKVEAELEQERRDRLEAFGLLDSMLESMRDAVVVVDGVGEISQVNEAASRLTRRSPHDLVGARAGDVFAPELPATPWDLLERFPDGRGEVRDTSVTTATGVVPVTVSCSVLRDGTGEVIAAVYAARDVSETQHLVHELADAEGRWRLLAELGDLLGSEVDPTHALPEACRWLATATSTGVAIVLTDGGTVGKVAASPPESSLAREVSRLVSRPLEQGSVLWAALREPETVHLPTVDGDVGLLRAGRMPAEVRSAAIVPLVARDTVLGALLAHSSTPGRIDTRMLSLLEETTERIALAIANHRLREALARIESTQEAARFREDLLAGVSHDMQTPLAILLGSLKVLRASDPSQDRAELYEGMARRGTQLRRLVQQFLDFSRLEAGHPIVVRPVMANVGPSLDQAARDIRGRPVQLHLPDDLPPAYVDPERLDQVLANLISNALKFSPPGSPISLVASATETTVEVVVADLGRGISASDLGRVFEKFQRGSDAAGTPGTGLGLYVSRALMEAQGGRLAAASRPGQGSQFRVVLRRMPPGSGERPPP